SCTDPQLSRDVAASPRSKRSALSSASVERLPKRAETLTEQVLRSHWAPTVAHKATEGARVARQSSVPPKQNHTRCPISPRDDSEPLAVFRRRLTRRAALHLNQHKVEHVTAL